MNKYLIKIAESSNKSGFVQSVKDFPNKHNELTDTAVIGGFGGITGMATHKALSSPYLSKAFPKLGPVGKFGISAGIGLLGDVAAVKTLKAIHVQGKKS